MMRQSVLRTGRRMHHVGTGAGPDERSASRRRTGVCPAATPGPALHRGGSEVGAAAWARGGVVLRHDRARSVGARRVRPMGGHAGNLGFLEPGSSPGSGSLQQHDRRIATCRQHHLGVRLALQNAVASRLPAVSFEGRRIKYCESTTYDTNDRRQCSSPFRSRRSGETRGNTHGPSHGAADGG